MCGRALIDLVVLRSAQRIAGETLTPSAPASLAVKISVPIDGADMPTVIALLNS